MLETREKRTQCAASLPFCAKLKLLWQPESGPIPVAMVEEDGVMTLFMRQQNTSAISRPGCDCDRNIYYKWKSTGIPYWHQVLTITIHDSLFTYACDVLVRAQRVN